MDRERRRLLDCPSRCRGHCRQHDQGLELLLRLVNPGPACDGKAAKVGVAVWLLLLLGPAPEPAPMRASRAGILRVEKDEVKDDADEANVRGRAGPLSVEAVPVAEIVGGVAGVMMVVSAAAGVGVPASRVSGGDVFAMVMMPAGRETGSTRKGKVSGTRKWQ